MAKNSKTKNHQKRNKWYDVTILDVLIDIADVTKYRR